MKKKLCIFLFLTAFFTQNLFAYSHLTHVFDYRGENIYDVCVSEFADGSNVIFIIDLNRSIGYCHGFENKSSAMESYELLTRLDADELELYIEDINWEYWFTQEDMIFYKFKSFVEF